MLRTCLAFCKFGDMYEKTNFNMNIKLCLWNFKPLKYYVYNVETLSHTCAFYSYQLYCARLVSSYNDTYILYQVQYGK